MSVRPLAIIVTDPIHARLHGALSVACAAAALGRTVRLFFQGPAVTLLGDRAAQPDSPAGLAFDAAEQAQEAAGGASARTLIRTAQELGVSLSACQTGLELSGLTAGDLPPCCEIGGLVAFLAASAEADLLLA